MTGNPVPRRALVRGDTGQQYAFRISHAGALLAEGRAAVMLAAPSARMDHHEDTA